MADVPNKLYKLYEKPVYINFIKHIRENYGMFLLDEFLNFYDKEKVQKLAESECLPDLLELWGNWPTEKIKLNR
jgi:hypothetical protein